jgi:hypothetical protein
LAVPMATISWSCPVPRARREADDTEMVPRCQGDADGAGDERARSSRSTTGWLGESLRQHAHFDALAARSRTVEADGGDDRDGMPGTVGASAWGTMMAGPETDPAHRR